MSESLFEQSKRVAVACVHCRERKIKCMATSQNEPCMRCRKEGLTCEFVSTEKQKARAPGSKTGGGGKRSPGVYSKNPYPSSPQTPSPGSDGQSSFYGGYDNNSSASAPMAQYAPSAQPTFGGNPYSNYNPNSSGGGGPPYRPPSQRNNVYPPVPSYQGASATQAYIPGTPPYLNAPPGAMPMQPAMYPGTGMNSGYPGMNYGYPYDPNASSPCVYHPNGPCYCNRRG